MFQLRTGTSSALPHQVSSARTPARSPGNAALSPSPFRCDSWTVSLIGRAMTSWRVPDHIKPPTWPSPPVRRGCCPTKQRYQRRAARYVTLGLDRDDLSDRGEFSMRVFRLNRLSKPTS